MRVIPTKSGPTLFVLETFEDISEELKISICRSSEGGIVLYNEWGNLASLVSVEELDEWLDGPIPSRQLKKYNLLATIRHKMKKHIREDKIDDLLRPDDYDPYMWA